jgi:hypothetical protein
MPLVIQDLVVRYKKGIESYGVALKPFNGRDALQDAYEEALDMCLYLRQALEERDKVGKKDTKKTNIATGHLPELGFKRWPT